LGTLREIIQYRELLLNLVSKDFELKYKGSFFGFLWSQLNPLLTLAVYTFVFKYVLKQNIENFPLFLMVGVVPWNAFVGGLSGSAVSVLSNGHFVKKVYFPRELLPIVAVLNPIIDATLAATIIVLGMLYFGVPFHWTNLLFPVLLFFQAATTVGLGMIFSALTVYYRDVKYLLDVFLFLLFFLTPIFYSPEAVPDFARPFLQFNPMAPLISSYRMVVLDGRVPPLPVWGVIALWSCSALAVGLLVFRWGKRNFAEEV
jgi:lipopolysaccharide transport system permease protein